MKKRTGRIVLAFGPGQECIESEYTTVNSGKFVLLGIGFFTSLLGGLAFVTSPSPERSASRDIGESADEVPAGSLEAQLREHRRNRKGEE